MWQVIAAYYLTQFVECCVKIVDIALILKQGSQAYFDLFSISSKTLSLLDYNWNNGMGTGLNLGKDKNLLTSKAL